MTDESAAPRRRRGRAAKAQAQTAALRQRDWSAVAYRQPAATIISDDEIESIHQASLTILEDVGMDFLLPEAIDLLQGAGATVSGERVRLDRALVDDALRTVPSQFTLHARNPAHNIQIGAGKTWFGSVASAPNASDLEGGRRAGNHADYQNFLKLIQSLNTIHFTAGYPVEPVDLHASIRHLDCLRDCAVMTDKVFHAYSLGRDRNLDALEITRIARGIDEATLEREPSLFTVINSSSPLRLDSPMLTGILEMARRNQVVCLTPFTLAGAMAPVTVAGAVAQQNAEALAGLVVTQLARPGAPFVYGGFTSNVDMRSGAPAFGTPEYMQAVIMGGQLTRRYGIPYRSSNVNAANSVDAQSAYESVFSLWSLSQAQADMVMHAAGWMEGGLCASFEKMILDADLLQMVAAFSEPVVVDDESLALEAVRDVGPGGHFFGTPHTQARYRDAFYEPIISDWRNFESWEEAGRPDAAAHANRVYHQLVDAYEPPAIDPSVREELDAFVEKRKSEGGVATDF